MSWRWFFVVAVVLCRGGGSFLIGDEPTVGVLRAVPARILMQ